MRVRIYIYALFLALLMFALQGCWREGLLSLRGEVNPGKAQTLVDGEPVVISDGATGVSVDTTYFEFEYENDVEPESVDEDTASITEGEESEECRPADRIESEAILSAPRLVRIIPQELNYNRKYTLCLSGIRAIDKTEFRAMKLTFRTELGDIPTVTSTSPSDGATGVSVDTVLEANFSESMDGSTIDTDTFLLESDIEQIEGTVSYTNPATFTPLDYLDFNTIYTATITTDVTDSQGIPLASDYTWSFTTQLEAWIKTYGGTEYDLGYSIQQTSDGGYIVAGATDSFSAWLYDPWILKLDQHGTIAWEKMYSGFGHDVAQEIHQTSDGGYIVGASLEAFALVQNYWVIKLNSDGTAAWGKHYGGGAASEWLYSIKQTSDGGYIVAGHSESYGVGGTDIWILKLNADGTVAWERAYGGAGNDYGTAILETSGGGYIVSGYTASFGVGGSDAWILKLNSDGTVAWEKAYGGGSNDSAYAIQETSDGGYIVAGRSESFGAVGQDAWIFKLTSAGAVTWEKIYGGDQNDQANAIQETSDGGYIVAGTTRSYGAGGTDAWMFKLSSDGSLMTWQKVYGGTSNDTIQNVIETPDGGYFAVGSESTLLKGDLWTLKLDATGGVGDSCSVIDTSSATAVDTSATVTDTAATVTVTATTVTNYTPVDTDTSATIDTLCTVP